LTANLAGGGLLDVGVYCVSLSVMILGEAIAATGIAEIGSTGVDEQGAAMMSFANGRLATSRLAYAPPLLWKQRLWVPKVRFASNHRGLPANV
jgi:predicted dehydrogenase